MPITAHDVTKIARLARIRVTDEEKEHYAKEIGGILQWIEQLQEVKTDGVPQMVSVADMRLPLREDKVTDGHQQAAILKNAPQAEYGCFGVPKVIE
jgi:aspartyl-tRNA(Asn)/glutamyl-tRNA(Gln) amidotransferase subunit C